MSLSVKLCSACSLCVKLHSVCSLTINFFKNSFLIMCSKNDIFFFLVRRINLLFAPIFLKTSRCWYVAGIVFSSFFCRTISLLFQVTFYLWKDSPSFIWTRLYFLPTKESSPQQSHSVTGYIDGLLGVMQGEKYYKKRNTLFLNIFKNFWKTPFFDI